MPDDEPTARITLTQVYKELQHIARKVDDLNTRLPTHIDATEKKLADHERRIRALETRTLTAVGAFGLLAAASPYISQLLIP